MEANTPEWCTAKLKTPRVPGLQWHQSQRKKRAATTGHFRDKGFGVSAGVRIGNRLFKGNRVHGEIKRGDSKPSEGRREIIQGFARLRLGNGRRPWNRAVTGGNLKTESDGGSSVARSHLDGKIGDVKVTTIQCGHAD
ncbi:hypothetical protein E3N88_27451 [Mikania micrantha]|uniref:Uncharacterized protein n=1 Tax=Mikania micrantha TaxID=192012 RepID=A0A5N6MXT6_9ASTR|nr:hypothetical protein E3N88_27451 [Mikania micrantha]